MSKLRNNAYPFLKGHYGLSPTIEVSRYPSPVLYHSNGPESLSDLEDVEYVLW